jgi:hypothetical protein
VIGFAVVSGSGAGQKLRKNALRLIDGLLSAFRKKKNDANA